MDKILRKLEELGLTNTQAKIYTGLIKLKKATVLQIARDTNIQRPTVYENAKILEKQGLIYQTLVGSKKYLAAEDPKRLYILLDKKRQLARETVEELSRIDEISTSEKTVIKLYNGTEGAKRLTEIMLHAKVKQVRTIGSYKENVSQLFSKRFLNDLWNLRQKRGVHTKVLYPEKEKSALSNNSFYTEVSNIRYNRKVRIMPKGVDFNVLYTVVDDKVLFWSSTKENFFYCIESQSYANSIRTLFDFLWNQSEPLHLN
jgi:sugar-specific transcriptional regulator TrmB